MCYIGITMIPMKISYLMSLKYVLSLVCYIGINSTHENKLPYVSSVCYIGTTMIFMKVSCLTNLKYII